MSKKKVDTKEIGLDIGLILSKQFFNSHYLHYGFFTDGLEPTTGNIYQAQKNYANFLLSKIPSGTKSILDVGAGSGQFALDLIQAGYEVDCVSPHPYLTKHVREKVGDKATIYHCGYEQVETDKKYDLVLFSESFQYIPLEESLPRANRHLKPGGHVLICDFFRRDVEGRPPIGGGHDLKKFHDLVALQPWDLVEDRDITPETAPSMDVVKDFLAHCAHPIWDLLWYVLDNNHPKVSKFLRWKFAHRIEKAEHKYLSQRSNAQNFAHFKTYHFLLYQKRQTA